MWRLNGAVLRAAGLVGGMHEAMHRENFRLLLLRLLSTPTPCYALSSSCDSLPRTSRKKRAFAYEE